MPDLSFKNEKEFNEFQAIARTVIDDFETAFNSRDPLRWASLVNFPHIRMTSGQIQIWNTPEEYARDNDPSIMSEKFNWAYSTCDWLKVILGDTAKIHVLLQFSRYDNNHVRFNRNTSLYILTKIDNRWGVQFRSSYLGIADGNSAF